MMGILEWTYFLPMQAIILLIYYLNRNRYEDYELKNIFQSKRHFLIMNSGVILTCIYLNIQRQLFCIPVTWATTLLLLFCISFLAFPFINKKSSLFLVASALSGLGFFIGMYIILFGRLEYLIFIAFNLLVFIVLGAIIWGFKKDYNLKFLNALWFYPAFVLAPYFIIFQLIILYRSLQTKAQKILFASSSVFVLLIGIALAYQVNVIFKRATAADNVERELVSLNQNPINNYLTELILGAHWKYHTEFCGYDGWRPPYHDPVLVISNKILFPFQHFGIYTKLYYNIPLYKKLYPDNPTQFYCRCAIHERLFDL